MSHEKTNRIVVYQLDDATKFEDLDLTDKGYSLEYSNEDKKLFLQVSKKSTPPWASYLEPYMEDGIDKIVNRSSSFVLIVSHENTVYALAGGYGYTALKGKYEDEFGLNVALRMINESEITSINQRSMKGSTRQLLRAVAGYEPLFDRDNYNRILKHIEGKGTFEGKTFRVSGRSSLVLRTTKGIDDITDVIGEVETILKLDEKIHFPRSYKLIKDATVIESLIDKLFLEFKSYWENDDIRDNIYLEFNDPLVQFRCVKFTVKFGRKSVELSDFDLDLIKQEIKNKGVDVLDGVGFLSKLVVKTEMGFSRYRMNHSFTCLFLKPSLKALSTLSLVRIGMRY